MNIEFYDVKTRQKVQIDEKNVARVTFATKNGTRYGLRARTDDGRSLTKFVSKAEWDTYSRLPGDLDDDILPR